MKIKVPNPANFCLHKLIISTRRRNPEKNIKDIQQAICTFSIVNVKELSDVYKTLPAKWRKAVINSLNNVKDSMPLYKMDIDKIFSALQRPT